MIKVSLATFLSYDNGQPAIVSSFGGNVGYYVNVYDKEGARMLASFTPTGNGCCMDAENKLR